MSDESYAYQCAVSALSLSGIKNPADVARIAFDFEARYSEVCETKYVSDEWAAYVRDVGGYANFHSYAAALKAGEEYRRNHSA